MSTCVHQLLTWGGGGGGGICRRVLKVLDFVSSFTVAGSESLTCENPPVGVHWSWPLHRGI